MNPLAYLLPALVTLLKAPPLSYEGQVVPAYEYVPGNRPTHYVLLTQPTAVAVPGGRGCRQWTCTALIDVVTQFPTDYLSSLPAEAIATQVTERIEGAEGSKLRPVLTLPSNYECGPAALELHSQLEELTGELVAIRRLLRYRFDIYYSPPAGPGLNARNNSFNTDFSPQFS